MLNKAHRSEPQNAKAPGGRGGFGLSWRMVLPVELPAFLDLGGFGRYDLARGSFANNA
jgi:hypothetical protein